MPRFFCGLILPVLFAACGDASHAADHAVAPPKVSIGPCHHAEFSGQCETFTWPLAGALHGELKATLRHFANGEERLLAIATFASTAMPIVGELVLVVRQGAPLGAADERFVEMRMPVRRDPQAAAVAGREEFSSMQPTAPFRLPATLLRTKFLGQGGAMLCIENQANQLELWSELHAPTKGETTQAWPWVVRREELLRDCVDGVEATVLTLEHSLEAPAVSAPR